LLGINRFFKLGMGKRELTGLAAKLGSDVAFFLDGPLALCTGRGEKVKKLEECEFRALLIVPNVSVSTKRVYENYRHDEAKYRRLSEEINVYIEKKRIDLVCSMCANILAESCFELHTELRELKKRIESLGVRPVCLSGSGSSMFCIINNSNEEGVKAYRDMLERDYGCKSIIVNNNSW
jgi:4-diphosphocytidyl-2-C-methyl-D-erythritol kinase